MKNMRPILLVAWLAILACPFCGAFPCPTDERVAGASATFTVPGGQLFSGDNVLVATPFNFGGLEFTPAGAAPPGK